MFQSAGLFKDIPCPYFIFGLCERPYCHFKHSKQDGAKVKASISQAAATSTETSKSEDEKYTVPANALERTLKDIEENIQNEKNKLKGISNVDSEPSVIGKPAIKTKPTGTPEYNPTPLTELKKQKNKGNPGRSKYDLALLEKPSSEQEYDPCSNFATSFKGTATDADIPEYAANIHGAKRTADKDVESDSPVAKIPKFASVEYTPALAEASFSDEEPAGEKEEWFSEDDSARDNTSVSDVGDNDSDNVKQVSETEEVHKDKLPFEFTAEGFIKVSEVKTSAGAKAKVKPSGAEVRKKADTTEVAKEKGTQNTESKHEEIGKKDEKKNIFSLFMAAAETVLAKASTEDKIELKSAIDEIKCKDLERRNSTESNTRYKAETSLTSSSNKDVYSLGTSEHHSKSSKSSDTKAANTDNSNKGDFHKRSSSKDKENKKNHSMNKERDKSENSNDKLKHLNLKSKNVKSLHKNHKHDKTESFDKSDKLHISKKEASGISSHTHVKHSSKNSSYHKTKQKHSSGVEHDRKVKHSDTSENLDARKQHSDIKNSNHGAHSREKKKHSNKSTDSVSKDSSSPKTRNDKPTSTSKRRRSSEKVKNLVKTRKIVDLNVDLFGADSDTETKDNDSADKTDNAKCNKKPKTDSDVNHYDSDIDLGEVDLDDIGANAEEDFSDLEKYFSEEDPFDECLRIFNEEGPSTSAGPEKKKLKKKEPENILETSSGKKRVGMMPNDPTKKKFTIEDKPKPKPSPAQVMMNRYKMIQQRVLEAEEKEKEKLKQKVRKISAQNALKAAPSTKNTIADASATFSNYMANKNKSPQKKTSAITVTKGQKRKAHTPTVPIEKLKRPVIETSSSSKVPTNVRQRYLNLMIDECLKLYKNAEDAYKRATEEEESVFSGVSNKNIYLNKAVNTIKRLRTEIENKAASSSKVKVTPVKVSHTGMLDGAQAAKTTFTLHRSGGAVKIREEDFAGLELYKRLEPYILTEEQLRENNFPRPDPTTGGTAIFYGEDFHAQKARIKGYEKVCVRCGKIFEVYPNGKYPKKEECVYHWGKAYKKKIAGALETRYTCCSGDLGSEGCQVSKAHVHETNKKENLTGYMKTIPCSPPPGGDYGVYALDCEMVYTTQGVELARVTVVGSDLEPIYEALVKPDRPVVDHNTRFSGITEEDLEDVTTTIRDVQAVLLSLFTAQTILIGHSLESDLAALKLIHGTVVDTSMVFPHRLGLPYKRALKNLMAEYLKKIIQDDVAGHDSHEDAISCLQLMQYRLKEDARKEGRR